MIRKLVVHLEETLSVAGRRVHPPARKAIAAAVISNPFAGRYEDDLTPLYDVGRDLAALLVQRAMSALEAEPADIEAYGKAAIVGLDGELEHAAALLHPKFGAPVRSATGGTEIIPSTKTIGTAGAAVTLPLTGKSSIWSVNHMDAAEIRIADAPHPNEVVVILALAAGGRPLHRIALPPT
jgi:hypothetical protein